MNEPKNFKVQIDKQNYDFDHPLVTGRELLTKAGKNPPENYAVYLKVPSGQPERISLDQQVDLREPGKEKFVTLPLDQTEGRGTRQDFVMPAEDMSWLEESGLTYELVAADGIRRVVMYGWPVCPGYTISKVDVNVRIDTGYPDAQIDMAYFFPPLVRTTGRPIDATSGDTFDGKDWQRWSRHRTTQNPWRPGIDNLSTHMAQVSEWLVRELNKA